MLFMQQLNFIVLFMFLLHCSESWSVTIDAARPANRQKIIYLFMQIVESLLRACG